MWKKFHITQIISVYTKYVLASPYSEVAFKRVMNLAGYMAGKPIENFQLGVHHKQFQKQLETQYPWLKDIQVPQELKDDFTSDKGLKRIIETLIKKQKDLYGKYLPVEKESVSVGELGGDWYKFIEKYTGNSSAADCDERETKISGQVIDNDE